LKRFPPRLFRRARPICVFRPKANTDSGASRTAIPGEAERSFRGKPNTDSGHAEQ